LRALKRIDSVNDDIPTNGVQKMKKTNILAVMAAVASFAAIPAASAQDVTCESANFSQAVLDQFGSIRFSCLDIVERNGEPHAVLKAEVVRVAVPNLTVRFMRSDDGISNPVTLVPGSDYIFTLDNGKKMKLHELSATSVLRVYVPVEAPIGKVGFAVDDMTGEVTYFELQE
jgi:hypothetical protein